LIPNFLIKIESTIDSQISIKEGIYSDIIITLWDQENKPLIFIANNSNLRLIKKIIYRYNIYKNIQGIVLTHGNIYLHYENPKNLLTIQLEE